jgi:hypothetical protein
MSMGVPGGSACKGVCIAAGVTATNERLGWRNEKRIQGGAWMVVNVAIGDVEG